MDRKFFLMRTLLFAVVGVCLLFETASSQKTANENFVPNEILVKFSPGVNSERITAAKRAIGGETVETFVSIGWQRIELPSGMSVKEIGRAHV